MRSEISRRVALKTIAAFTGGAVLGDACVRPARAEKVDPKIAKAVEIGLKWLANNQSKLGHWVNANNPGGNYPTSMTALCGTALICAGSTTTQGPYSKHIRRAVDYLMGKARSNGLIGDPLQDNRYTYGHGFSMLFLSQVLGEEEDEDRRKELVEVLDKAVEFCARAQTAAGGWGYVSAKDGNDFDEGSTTVTQVQGLRGCRNAGITVPGEIIQKAKDYIYVCKNPDGGISYSSKNKGTSRPAITAAALAALYNAGDYDSKHVPEMLAYCKKHLIKVGGEVEAFGHWHYTHLYFAQVMYREGAKPEGRKEWEEYRAKLFDKILREQISNSGDSNYGSWNGNIGPVYVTANNLTMLQLDLAYLPIYQR